MSSSSWLNELLAQHEEFETPKQFWYWSALATISAVLKDSIYLDKFLYKLYPNIYVMLHADSGQKKGPPVSMAKQLVRAVNNTRIISGRSSIQGILKKLGTSETKPGGQIINSSVAFICSSELSSSIVEDKAATNILVDLYDRNYNAGDWESLLKAEAFALKDATVTMLTATNEAMSEEMFLRKEVQGGYFARTFIVRADGVQNINSLMFPPKIAPNYPELAKYLKEVAKLKGQLVMDIPTREYFRDWYTAFTKIARETRDPTGTLNRLDDSILKVAILISIGNEPTLIITREAIDQAIKQCEKLVGNVRKVTLGQGKSHWANEKALVINLLLDRTPHIISRQQLHANYWMRANVNEWDDIMLSLQAAGVITIETVGNVLIYRMPDKQVEEWSKHLRGGQ